MVRLKKCLPLWHAAGKSTKSQTAKGHRGVVNTRIIHVENREEQQAQAGLLREAGEILRAGGLVAFPTETVYGLGGDALNPDSSRKIYAAKGRPSDNPLIVHICRMEDLPRIVKKIPKAAEELARAFWPGPLTMIFQKSDEVPCETTGGLDTVAVRMPGHPVALALIEASGGYVAAPSANRSGKPSPTSAKHVIEDMMGRIDVILEGGDAQLGIESTIVDLTEDEPVILRPGFITKEMLERVLHAVGEDQTMMSDSSGQAPKAPGMKYRHYAPDGDLMIISGEEERVIAYINEHAKQLQKEGHRVGVIGTDRTIARYCGDVCKSAGSREDERTVARELYRILREFDEEGVTVIYSESFDAAGIGQAVMNRLLKAAGHKILYLK